MKNRLLRTFIAIPAPHKVKNVKQMLISTMENEKSEIRWVKHNNLHLTIKFLGFTPENKIEEISNDIDKIVKSHNSFHLSISDTGCFPNKTKPSVLYLGIDGDLSSLFSLVSDTEELFLKKGYPKLQNDFFPHVTLARIKYPQKFTLNSTSFLNSSYDSIDFPVNHVQFFSSEILPEGVFYNLLGTFPLSDI